MVLTAAVSGCGLSDQRASHSSCLALVAIDGSWDGVSTMGVRAGRYSIASNAYSCCSKLELGRLRFRFTPLS